MKKAQLFTGDLVFGLFVFMVTFFLLIQTWQTSYDHIWGAEKEYEMNWLVETVSDQLVRTAGDPYDWNPADVVAVGLAESRGSGKVVESRVLDADKVLYLIQMFDENYSYARDRLLGSGTYDVYLELSCLNSTDLHCLQGLTLDSVKESVTCKNQNESIHVNSLSKDTAFTDVYLWLEAEDLWGHYDDSHCSKGCSGDNMSNIGSVGNGKLRTVRTMPGDYMIWARIVDANSPAQLVVDGASFRLYNRSVPGLVGWVWVGNKTLRQETTLSFDRVQSGNDVDALLLTTDRFYDPRIDHVDTLGDPSLKGTCVVGNTKEGADIISRIQTAVIGTPFTSTTYFEGMQPVISDTLLLKVVVWGGEAMEPRNKTTPSTSTTVPPVPTEILCLGSPGQGCQLPHISIISLKNVTLWGPSGVSTDTMTCGSGQKMTVKWYGRHAGDPNYFGFFIENASYFVGACQSNNNASEVGLDKYTYDMNCTMNPSNTMDLPDGPYDLVVTGNDYNGYCFPYPVNSTWDDERRFRVNLRDCVNYQSINCVQPAGVSFQCLKLSETITKVSRVEVAGGLLSCDANTQVDVFWGGTHGLDKQVQWTFMLNTPSGYKCVGLCRSMVAANEPKTTYYDMRCNVNLNGTDCSGNPYTVPDGSYDLYAIGESDGNRYCTDPNSPNVEGWAVQTVAVDCPTSMSSSSSSGTTSSSASSSGSSASSASSGGAPVILAYNMPVTGTAKQSADLYTNVNGPATWDVTPVQDGSIDITDGPHQDEFIVPGPGTYNWNINITFVDGTTENLYVSPVTITIT